MKWYQRLKIKRRDKKFNKIFDMCTEYLKKALLFEPNTSEVHTRAVEILKTLLEDNGCTDVNILIHKGEDPTDAFISIGLKFENEVYITSITIGEEK